MVKADLNRDYYADLELPPTADAETIKKQFRKLALKYHPDRNPGREAEVNSKFQTIQSANEVLTNPEQKARYDAHIARNRLNVRFPTASGVRGNPWSRMGDQYPQPPMSPNRPRAPNPPKRPNMPKRPTTSGADKYKDFTARPPPSSPKPPTRDPDPTFKAWSNMRPNSKGKASPTAESATGAQGGKGTGPQPIPRANSTRQQASFGHRVNRTGFTPSSPGGDEPPVTNKNYFTTRTHTNLFNETSANARNRRRASSNAESMGDARDSFLDPRQSTPYQTRGGERLNPFDGTPKRSTSTREPPRPKFTKTEAATPNSHRQRSASVPGTPEDSNAGSGSNAAPSRAEERYKPRGYGTDSGGSFTAPNSSTSSLNGGQAAANGAGKPDTNGNPNVYAKPDTFIPTPSSVCSNGQPPQHPISHAGGEVHRLKSLRHISAELRELYARMSSSEDAREGLNPFENKMRELLDGLAVSHSPLNARKEARAEKQQATTPNGGKRSYADHLHPDSFSFKFDEDVFTPTSHRFTRNSADNINTRFVAEEHKDSDWKFNAGSAEHGTTDRPTPPRSRSSGRLGRRSPFRTQSKQTSFVDPAEMDTTAAKQGSFDPEEWSQKINPEIFVPQQPQRTSVSPTRATRAATKKARPVRQTMGTAGLVDEEESSSGPDDKSRPPPVFGSQPQSTNSPSAMDIDSPPIQPSDKPQVNGARKIPVEPSRAEWRAGDVNGVKSDTKAPSEATPTFVANAAGSEDSEEFMSSFADFRKVEPFAEHATGLSSFGDLKSNLPFESKASGQLPIKKPEVKPANVPVPKPPEAPRPPPTLAVPTVTTNQGAWQKYVDSFHDYMRDWRIYNTKFVEHFRAREKQIQQVKAINYSSWLDSRDDSGIQEYLAWAEQDRQVRDKWTVACNNHEQHVREFMAYRTKMKTEVS